MPTARVCNSFLSRLHMTSWFTNPVVTLLHNSFWATSTTVSRAASSIQKITHAMSQKSQLQLGGTVERCATVDKNRDMHVHTYVTGLCLVQHPPTLREGQSVTHARHNTHAYSQHRRLLIDPPTLLGQDCLLTCFKGMSTQKGTRTQAQTWAR